MTPYTIKGRKPDSVDTRDHVLPAIPGIFLPRVDLRVHLPPAWDQGRLSSCGPTAGAALMSYLYPDEQFSRLQIYYDVRKNYGDPYVDTGVETRDVLKALVKFGAMAESAWPYVASRMFTPPPGDTPRSRLTSYARLGTREEFLSCLSDGYPFMFGFNCCESFSPNNRLLARDGIMLSNWWREKMNGGHIVLAVGYDLQFRSSTYLKRSGIDPSLVPDEVLLLRNSWGPKWGDGGHFWMPLNLALHPVFAGDAWTGRV